jgi:hypothetical protein
MDIQDLGAIGEFISSFAVLITLIYVAVQLRETRNALGAQAYQERTFAQQDALLRVAENSDLAAVLTKFQPPTGLDFDLDAFEKLEPVEQTRIRTFHQAFALRFDNTAFQYQSGYISDSDMEFLLDGDGLPKFLRLWKKLDIRVNPALQRYIDTKGLATQHPVK